MNPGRELDALVAEKVMDVAFVRKAVGDGPWRREIFMLLGVGCKCGTCETMGNRDMIHGPLMHGMVYPQVQPYSTDIAAAWEVVEKMREKGLAVEVFYGWECGEDFQKDDWVAQFEGPAGRTNFGVTKSAPHAICLAALKAVEVST